MNPPFPWQASTWAGVRAALAADRLAQALLITGPRGVGKVALARELARTGLCEHPDSTACGTCPGCQQFSAGAHPDFLEVRRLEDKREILIDQIREFCAAIQLTASQPRGRFALIQEADRLNANAANALLKTLEEPPRNVTIMLTVEHISSLPMTIRSRCARVSVPMPGITPARNFLRQAGVDIDVPETLLRRLGPCALLQAGEGVSTLVSAERNWEELITRLERDGDVVSAAAGIEEAHFDDFMPWWQQRLLDDLKSGRKGSGFKRLWDALATVRRQGQGSFNRLLALEGLFILYLELAARQKDKA